MSAKPTIKFMALPLAELARQRLRERNNRASSTFTPRPLCQNLRFCHLPFQGRLDWTLLAITLVIFHKNTAIVLWCFYKKLFRYDIIHIHSCKRLRKEVL